MVRTRKFLDSLQILGTVLIVIGLPLGIFLMSLGSIILVCAWILGGDLKNKFLTFFRNKHAIGIASVFLVYLLGSLYSSDMSEASKELKNILPILFFPIVFSSTKQISKKTLFLLLHLFIISVLVNSLISYANYFQNPDLDYRKIVRFVSHIRLSLMIVFVIHILGYYSIKRSWVYRIISVIIITWLLYFMNIYESATGVIVLIVSLFVTSIFLLLRTKKRAAKYIVLPLLLFIGLSSLVYVIHSYAKYFDAEEIVMSELDKTTANGREYFQTENFGTLENGKYVWKYFCQKELVHSWLKVTNKKHKVIDGANQDDFGVLARYLTSKGLRKDSIGVFSLTQTDIKNVQNGITNHLIPEQNGFTKRMNEIFYEIDRFKDGADPSGSSLIGRLYYWEAAINLIKENPIIGVGTGSLKDKLAEEYKRIDSALNDDSRQLIHNQFLTFAVQFGILGLIWILVVLIKPMTSSKNSPYLYFIFFSIFMLSCITEDTINTQAGLTFFILFYSLFFLLPDNKSQGLEANIF